MIKNIIIIGQIVYKMFIRCVVSVLILPLLILFSVGIVLELCETIDELINSPSKEKYFTCAVANTYINTNCVTVRLNSRMSAEEMQGLVDVATASDSYSELRIICEPGNYKQWPTLNFSNIAVKISMSGTY